MALTMTQFSYKSEIAGKLIKILGTKTGATIKNLPSILPLEVRGISKKLINNLSNQFKEYYETSI
jgi:hypothetical protein